MANPEHLAILKQGVPAWNAWRRERPDVVPDLSATVLTRAHLAQADLHDANLTHSDLQLANLSGATLIRANLRSADLTGSNLERADLSAADLQLETMRGANFTMANLSGAKLTNAACWSARFDLAQLPDADLAQADLSLAELNYTNLYRASLHLTILQQAILHGTYLTEADLSEAKVLNTHFADLDLSDVRGLASVLHVGPSTVGIDTIYKSKGRIPDVFLRGAGVPEDFITYMHALVNNPIDYYTCFISYSSKDQTFAEQLSTDLHDRGVRNWFAPKDMRIGARIRPAIDDAIRVYDKLLLILSEHSIASAWVEKEVETAFDKEIRAKKTVLFPIRLDDTVMSCDQAWAADIRRTRHIGDFTQWKDHDAYQVASLRLFRDLKASEDSRPRDVSSLSRDVQ